MLLAGSWLWELLVLPGLYRAVSAARIVYEINAIGLIKIIMYSIELELLEDYSETEQGLKTE